MKYDIAAFIWPSYTGDEPRTRIFWPEGYGEWQTVKSMTCKGYKGCRWPRIPTWGYVNEADSRVMEMQIDCAVSHGVNVFIYDWYWYDNRPFLENCLNDGFLRARNNTDMKFCLMWANHDATHLWDKRNSDNDLSTVIWSGVVTPEIFSNICDRTIEKYFSRENYYTIDGCPVYMIFDIDNFVRSFGTSQECKKGIEEFRRKTVEAGFNGLHFQVVHWSGRTYNWFSDDDINKGVNAFELYDYLGVDSVTSYNWGCSVNFDGDYTDITAAYTDKLASESEKLNIPFYPNISVGWDNNVRFNKFIPGVVENNTPENFKTACEKVKAFADESMNKGVMKAPFITVNSWNEWTETSYLQPDDLYGYGYLEAIKDVFGESPKFKAEAQEKWGETHAYKEYAEKTKDNSKDKWNNLAEGMDEILAEFAVCMKNGKNPDSSEVQRLVRELQKYITENYYTCTNEILSGLGQMYVLDERFKNNIDKHADGTADFIIEAIKFYCK